MTIHRFNESLDLSNRQADAPWWLDVYRKAFPDLASAVCIREDGWAQRGGIDRVLTLESGRQLTVDEKVRAKAYPDVLLEYWSSEEHQRPGWIAKGLACDYIAYAYIPTQECLLLPFLTLRRAWSMYGERWIKAGEAERGGFRITRARNQGYTTVSVAVPRKYLFDCMQDAMSVSWAS